MSPDTGQSLKMVHARRPRRFQFGLRTLLIAMTVGGTLLGALGIWMQYRIEESRQEVSINNMKQMGLALHGCHAAHGAFPVPANTDAAGRPLLSWRVHLLPYLEHDVLYRQFHWDEPWDSPHNSKLISQMPGVYRSPSRRGVKDLAPGMTCYLAPVGPDTIFPDNTDKSVVVGLNMMSISDGTSNTIMLVEAAPEWAVVWTRPDDWQFDPGNPRQGLMGHRRDGFLAALADGYVRLIPAGVSDETLRRLFNRHDGLRIDGHDLEGNATQGAR